MQSQAQVTTASPDATQGQNGLGAISGPPLWRRFQRTPALVTIAFGVFLLILWQIVGSSVDPILLSNPTAIVQSGYKLISDGTLVSAFSTSMQAFVPGYLLAALVGIPLGLVVGRYRIAEAAAGVYITAGYATPLVALVPLYIVWFGIGFAVKVAIIFTLAVFPVLINTWRGVRSVPKSLVEVGQAFGASNAQIMYKIIVPGTLPHIMTGLRLGVGRAVIGMVIAEFFTAVGGLGGIIINAGNSFDTARMFVPIITIMVIGVVLTWLVGRVEKKLTPWHEAMGAGT
jgi:ABC-type nitrate/sulfonate/bicarbonate transport system permease component